MAAVVVFACTAFLAFAYVQAASDFHESESYQQRVASCETQSLGLLANDIPHDVQRLEDVSHYCYDNIRRTDELSKSMILRGLYIHQRFENNVILFMVVLITLSGVALSGLQLLTSYNLAATGHLQGEGATDLSLEQGKLSIKSSVTGLVVLAFSLAFFFIYISQVYRIIPASASPADKGQTVVAPASVSAAPSPGASQPPGSSTVLLAPGGLGPAPASPVPEGGNHH